MKKLLVCCFLLFTLTTSYAETLDFIAAKVNDDIITNSELQQQAKMVSAQLQQQNIKLPPREQFLNQVLQMMINEELQVQIAHRAGITVSDAEVQQAIAHIAAQDKLSSTQLIHEITKQGVTYATYAKNMHNQLLVQKVQKEIIVPQVNINPEEINTYLRSVVNNDEAVNVYHVEDILVGVSDAPTPGELEAAEQKAENIMMKLQAGSDFRTLAVAESSGQEALQGGDLGWRPLAELPAVFAEQIEKMHPDDLAGPIRTPNGYHIIHLLGIKRNANAPSDTGLKNRVGEMLFRQAVEEKLQLWIQQLHAQSYIQTYLPNTQGGNDD